MSDGGAWALAWLGDHVWGIVGVMLGVSILAWWDP